NIYVNRNMIGAVVGVQPFGGEGLSGSGPKAGGPLYLHRLLRGGPPPRLDGTRSETKPGAFSSLAAWVEAGASGLLSDEERGRLSGFFEHYRQASPLPVEMALPGPVGEENRLQFLPRGRALGIAGTAVNALHQFGAALATGNRFILAHAEGLGLLRERILPRLQAHIEFADEWQSAAFDAVMVSDQARVGEVLRALAARPGPIVQAVCGSPEFSLFRLVKEKTISINTAAAGGNASLMTIGR
ncbi:MAG: trifunctional transcriptional regulator/proline dehydrogenase/L-glutamate gamma-semialdehyde dehydrogenase, partial [Rhodomicrobium sp.]|nr:trifunctional transcriptional regulator/proline dehydrogenase/L-glutamate gamma-semialdehyde dehydrogenase [Rhodomicrobium sp.]